METTVERLLAAAREILLVEGAAAVSMRRVATAAGVTAMTIYRHFANRDALLAAVADASFAEIAQRWAARPRAADFDTRWSELLDDHLDFALGEPRLYDFVFTERREGARRWPDDFRAGGSPSLNLVADALADGVRQGVLRDEDIWDWALTLAALIHGLVAMHRGGRIDLTEAEMRSLCHQLVGGVIHGYRA
ncbi:AcrR family transcriptional regulator [Allocatelliglobosispora scoriae]|uniref:AcrR family transcriptional regulator n=1 Tax=Allocatelliglobosispora scoriae TaxID=643052 RepID=A0A841C5U3_9ACTN|nr:TetR/AcrR family transcriptional regulator [Allocatelliglobosispora scoriae]MBB5874442.1 AcrR family transcriptional regulator [Allocatelliglobosispora scoriae]